MTKFNNIYNFNKKKIKGISFKGHPEVCNQQLSDEVDVKSMIKQYILDGPTDVPVVRDLTFGDATITYDDFKNYKDIIKQVADDYNSLPVDTQRQFGSVDRYVDYLSQAYAGNENMLQKMQNSNIALSPVKGADVGASGTPSSSLSRSDSKNFETNLNSTTGAVLQNGKE